MSKSTARKILRIAARVLIGVVATCLLLAIAVHLPQVQRFLTGKLENALEARLKTSVGIGGIHLKFPGSIAIDDVYVNTPEGNTLLRLDEAAVSIGMWHLFVREVCLHSIRVRGLQGRVVVTDSSSNVAFLQQAFPGAGDTAVVTGESASWKLRFPSTTMVLRNSTVYWQDDTADLLFDINVGTARLEARNINLEQRHFQLAGVLVENSRIHIETGTSGSAEETMSGHVFSCDLLSVRQTRLDLDLDTLHLDTEVKEALVSSPQLELGESMSFSAGTSTLQVPGFTMDRGSGRYSGHFDAEHLDLEDASVEFSRLLYLPDSLSLSIRYFSARAQDDLVVEKISGDVSYTAGRVQATDFLIRTPLTNLSAADLGLRWDPDSIANRGALAFRADVAGFAGFPDALWIAPDLARFPVFQTNENASVAMTLKGTGDRDRVSMSRLHVEGPGLKYDARIDVRNPLEPDSAGGEMHIAQLVCSTAMVLPFIPDSLLPGHILWPEVVESRGSLSYTDGVLQLQLDASEHRQGGDPDTRLQMAGTISHLRTSEPLTFDMHFDTVVLTRRSLYAYLPSQSFSEEYSIPEFVRGSGSANGRLSDVNFNLRFEMPGDSTRGTVQGRLLNLPDPEHISGDLMIRELVLAASDIRQTLPDSLLPGYISLPGLKIENGVLSGSLKALQLNLPVTTTAGSVHLSGNYDADSLDVHIDARDFAPELLFSGPLHDTIRKLDLGRIAIKGQASGKYSLPYDLHFDTRIWNHRGDSLLTLSGFAQDSALNMTYAIVHTALSGHGDVSWQKEGTWNRIDGVVVVDSAHLHELGVVETPLTLTTEASGSIWFASEDRIRGSVVLEKLSIQSAESTSYVDSIVIDLERRDSYNVFNIRSDIADIDLRGHFSPGTLSSSLTSVVRSYWREGESVVPDYDSLDMQLRANIRSTQLLTSGLIEGLDQLSPFTMTMDYQSADRTLTLDLTLPKIAYQGLEAEDMKLHMTGASGDFSYRAEWRDIRFNDQMHFGETRIAGNNQTPGLLSAEITVLTEEDSIRHRLGFYVDMYRDTFALIMGTHQRLNFDAWTLPEDNLLRISGDSLLVRNWELRAGEQKMTAESTNGNDLVLTFDDFELSTLARLVNTERDLASGGVNGEIGLSNIFGKAGITSDAVISELHILNVPMGVLTARIETENTQTYSAHVALDGHGNAMTLAGSYSLTGAVDLILDVQALQVESLRPFVSEYIEEAEGYLTGRAELGNTFSAPDLRGTLRFHEAAVKVNGTRYRIGDAPVTFDGERITLSNITLYDAEDQTAHINGDIVLRSMSETTLDLRVSARNFLALNSTKADNALYYGRLAIDADATISGTIGSPVIELTATSRDNSNLTYVYGRAQSAGIDASQGVVRFVEQHRWSEVMVSGASGDTMRLQPGGTEVKVNLDVKDNVQVTILIDPLTGQKFTGRAYGNLTYQRFPNGLEELVGRLDFTAGTYDFVYQGFLKRTFEIAEGSSIMFTGDMLNPVFDLRVRHAIRTSPLPLVSALNPQADLTGLRRTQTFQVIMDIEGDLQQTELTTDIIHPEDVTGNIPMSEVDAALTGLRADQSRLRTTAFSLLAFRSFSFPMPGTGENQSFIEATNIASLLERALSQALSTTVGSIEIDFGVESYQDEDQVTRVNSRVSLRETLFDDRLIISVDGVLSTERNEATGASQTYLDNITAEYILNEQGNLRLRIFNDRDHNILAGDNVIRYGGRLVFSKDFERIRWFTNKRK